MKKFLTLMLGICLIIPCAFMFTGCKDKEPEAKMETWDGTIIEVSVEDADADGVITIDTAEKLAGFAVAVNAGESFAENTIKLACNMDMANRTWTPIGVGYRKQLAQANEFAGTFDGNGKKIIGLNNGDYIPLEEYSTREGDLVDEVYTYHYGFFGFVVDATIKNLELTVNFNCNLENLKGDSVGGLVGFSGGKLTIDNCVVNGTINGGFDAVGGLVGRAYNSSDENKVIITNCENNANVTALYKAAGILGYASSSTMNITVEGCVNNGAISATGVNVSVQQSSRVDKRFVSMTGGIVLYAWAKNSANTVIVTNNTNNGDLITPAMRSTENDRENLVSYAYIAALVSGNDFFKAELHSYDFRGNENFGSVVNKPANETALLAFVDNLSADEYTADYECNGTTNPEIPVVE